MAFWRFVAACAYGSHALATPSHRRVGNDCDPGVGHGQAWVFPMLLPGRAHRAVELLYVGHERGCSSPACADHATLVHVSRSLACAVCVQTTSTDCSCALQPWKETCSAHPPPLLCGASPTLTACDRPPAPPHDSHRRRHTHTHQRSANVETSWVFAGLQFLHCTHEWVVYPMRATSWYYRTSMRVTRRVADGCCSPLRTLLRCVRTCHTMRTSAGEYCA